MPRRIVIRMPAHAFDAALADLFQSCGGAIVLCSCGYRERGDDLLVLTRSHERLTRSGRGVRRRMEEIRSAGLWPLVIMYDDRLPRLNWMRRFVGEVGGAGMWSGLALALVRSWDDLRAYGRAKLDGEGERAVEVLSLPGPRMLKLSVNPLWPGGGETDGSGGAERTRPVPAADGARPVADRLATFLGRGNAGAGGEVRDAARRLRVVVVGAGRSGHLLALHLAQSGVRSLSSLIVADGDVLEEGNLDFAFLPRAALGMPKAEAVALMARALELETDILPVVGTISDCRVADAIVTADVVFSCVDRPSARVGVAVLAARHHVVHVDLAAGASYVDGGGASWGAEVRVHLPGRQPCVACMGEHEWEAARRELDESDAEEKARRATNDSIRERPGSAGMMNLAAVSEATLEFWKLLLGRRERSAWFHLDANGDKPDWLNWTGRARRRLCPVCRAGGLQGLGGCRRNGGVGDE